MNNPDIIRLEDVKLGELHRNRTSSLDEEMLGELRLAEEVYSYDSFRVSYSRGACV